jgi:hypothetical protein
MIQNNLQGEEERGGRAEVPRKKICGKKKMGSSGEVAT